jgi:hypothetical protein
MGTRRAERTARAALGAPRTAHRHPRRPTSPTERAHTDTPPGALSLPRGSRLRQWAVNVRHAACAARTPPSQPPVSRGAQTHADALPRHRAPADGTTTHTRAPVSPGNARTRPLRPRELSMAQRTHWLPSLPSQQFQVLFNSLFKVLFIFPSRYLFAIGLSPVFSFRSNLRPTLSCNPKQLDSWNARRTQRTPGTRRGSHPL